MFGHDYTREEQDALDAIREREVWGSISPAGLHNDYKMYPDSDDDVQSEIDHKKTAVERYEFLKKLLDYSKEYEQLAESQEQSRDFANFVHWVFASCSYSFE